jgi:hypothetical protein
MDIIWIDFVVIFIVLGFLLIGFLSLEKKVDRLLTSQQNLIDIVLKGKTAAEFGEIIEESKSIEERQQRLEKRVYDLENKANV